LTNIKNGSSGSNSRLSRPAPAPPRHIIAPTTAALVCAIIAVAALPARSQDLSNNQTCLGCHGNPGFSAPRGEGEPRSLYVDPAQFEKSVMGKVVPCIGCHATITEIPHQNISANNAQLRQGVPAMCGTCHSAELKLYTTSVHGQEVLANNDPWAAVCSDCHSAHGVERPSADVTRLAIIKNCGNCHEQNFKSYRATYHGQVTTLGYAYTAKCFDCHGSHAIKRVSDPESTVYPANRVQTCRKCHANATAGFATFQPHATTDDFARYPQTWIASKFMLLLLGGTFAFFWTHSALWLYREYREREQHKPRPHVRTDALPDGDTLYYRRWPAGWRLAHLVFALVIILLILTGMTLFYADSVWAPAVQRALGGPVITGLVHRVCAVIFVGIFLGHLAYVAYRIAVTWKTFRWFGSRSLIPNWEDIKDIFLMFKWFFGFGSRPMFDRFTYWEKFDYWAPFWGVTIIGVSGFMLWFPNLTAAFLPGWAFNVATIFHGEEAFLAAGFLFTVHFFNNHWRPDNFPLDIVMFTGVMPLDKFKREHRIEYDRLAASGDLKRYIVDAPSVPMTIGSKILGFFLMAVGLILLVLIMAGFVRELLT
jgi:cytochrome b subunit of formate dehydrogenase